MGNQLTCPSATAVILTAILSGVCDSASTEPPCQLSPSKTTKQADEPVELNENSIAHVETWEGDELTDKDCKLSLFVIRRDLGKKIEQSFQQGKKQIFYVPAPEAKSSQDLEGHSDGSSYEVKSEDLKVDDHLNAISSSSFLLDWEVSGYAFGRKMLADPFGESRQKELKEFWKYKKETIKKGQENDGDIKHFRDMMRMIGVNEHWYVYVKLTDPLDDSQEPRYVKLHLVIGEAALEEESRLLAEQAGIDLGNLHKSTMIMVDVLSEKIFNKREKKEGGARITDLDGSLTLRDMFFRNPHDHQTCYQPSPEKPGTTELGLVMNCKTYAMRVLKKLGVEKNPMGWSYDNKKQGYVYRKKELAIGMFVRLNDKTDEDVYTITKEQNGDLYAIHNTEDETVKLTVIKCEPYGNLVKEVREIVEGGTSLKDAGFDIEGPYTPGISRIWMYGYFNGGKIYYDTVIGKGKTRKMARSVPLFRGDNKPAACNDMRSGWYVYGKCLNALPFRAGLTKIMITPESVVEFWNMRRDKARAKKRLIEGEGREE